MEAVLVFVQHHSLFCQVSDTGEWQQRASGVPFQAAAGERGLAEVALRIPAPSSATAGFLSSLSLPSSSSDLCSAYMGTAALQLHNGALLIIGNSVLAQVMTAKMYLPKSRDGQLRH
ncbi:hypothetical protein Q8A73_021032 [Channa argus]|nr:hypothetical protein Q8A73_021032 [Channa argus]